MWQRVVHVCLLLAVGTVMVAGCEEEQDTRVEFEASGSIVDDTIIVEGTATVPDGARIDYVLDDPIVDIDGEVFLVRGDTIVNDESFRFEVSVEGWIGDSVEVWIAFQPSGQPSEVVSLYGSQGENIEGDNVVELGDPTNVRRVEYEFTVSR